MEELKECPFCGSNDLTINEYENTNLKYYVHCQVCLASGGRDLTEQQAIKAWNTRYNEIPHKGVVR